MSVLAVVAIALVAAVAARPARVATLDLSSQVQLSLNATTISDGDWVQLSWSGVPEAERASCWIGVFSPDNVDVSTIPAIPYPATAPWTATAALKYQVCSADPSFASTGAGSYNFRLLDMRETVAFWLFYNGTTNPVAVSKSDVISFTHPEAPRHGVLALTADPTEMRLTWNSKFPTPGFVNYTVNGAATAVSIPAKAYTYTTDDLCGEPGRTQGWREPGFFHTAVIKGLTPGTDKVSYIYGNDQYGWSETKTFTAAKSADPNAALRVLVAADVGATEPDHCSYHWIEPNATQTYQHMTDLASSADVVLHIGDISYATGYSAKWELFMAQAEPLGSVLPIMTALGNHEQDTPDRRSGTYYGSNDSGGECAQPTNARFPMPVPSHNQFSGWYSFDMGPVHFITINTELEVAPGSDQYDFITDDIAQMNRSETPWLVMMGHRPMYYVRDDVSAIDPHFQVLESLMYENKVDLFLVGHVHNALVTCPVYNGTCAKSMDEDLFQGTVHVCVGNGGMSLDKVPKTAPAWGDFMASDWGYATLDVANKTHLTMSLFEDSTNVELYSFSLKRNYPRAL